MRRLWSKDSYSCNVCSVDQGTRTVLSVGSLWPDDDPVCTTLIKGREEFWAWVRSDWMMILFVWRRSRDEKSSERGFALTGWWSCVCGVDQGTRTVLGVGSLWLDDDPVRWRLRLLLRGNVLRRHLDQTFASDALHLQVRCCSTICPFQHCCARCTVVTLAS